MSDHDALLIQAAVQTHPQEGGPYARGASAYLDAGWDAPIPIGRGRRDQPARGYTGEEGRRPTRAQVQQWIAQRGADNLGLRMPATVIGIDLDEHDGKGGLATFSALAKKFGDVPDTWRSTSRAPEDEYSGIYFYRVPPGVAMTLRDLGAGVEVIRPGHRYAAVWPTVSEKTGRIYQWYPPGSDEQRPSATVPRVDQLPELPERWYEAHTLTRDGTRAHAGDGGWTHPLIDRLLTDGVPLDGPDPQDAVLRDVVYECVALGLSDAVVRLIWEQIVARTPLTRPDEPFGLPDFQRHLHGARGKLGAGLPEQMRRFALQVAATGAGEMPAGPGGGDGKTPEQPEVPPSDAEAGNIGPFPAPDAPLATARRLLPEWTHAGASTRWFWRGGWWVWTGAHWHQEEEGAFQSWLYRRLEHEFYLKIRTVKGVALPELVAWNPNRKTVQDVERAVQAVLTLERQVEGGAVWDNGQRCWRRSTGTHLACRNGVVRVADRTLHGHTAGWLNLSSVPFDFDPRARCPQWLTFLEQILPGEADTIAQLQEWFGYVLSGRTDLQKMMYLVGPPRSGKGTIDRVLKYLLGPGTCASPTLSSFASNFGLSSFIGKPLAVISDARTSRRLDMQAIVERILSVTGEDSVDVDRKNQAIWTGQLGTRLMWISNDLPWFQDTSGAMTKRLLITTLTRSFVGREDTALLGKLTAEASGILNWALEGLERLDRIGCFTSSAGGESAASQIAYAASPVTAFLEEECVLEEGQETSAEELFLRWYFWRGDIKDDRGARTSFGMQLRSAAPHIQRVRGAAEPESKRPWLYRGVRLRSPIPRGALDGLRE